MAGSLAIGCVEAGKGYWQFIKSCFSMTTGSFPNKFMTLLKQVKRRLC
jgi:hypothetical protein